MSPPSFRERMRNAGSFVKNQAMGRGYQAKPFTSGLALAPAQGLANMVGLGQVFSSLQAGIQQNFERARQLENANTRFRGSLTGVRGEGGEKFLDTMMTQLSNKYNKDGKLIKEERFTNLGFSAEDVASLGNLVASSGAKAVSVKEAGDTALITGAIERGFNISAESQAQFLGSFSRKGMMDADDSGSFLAKGREDLRRAISVGMSESGAGLMSADIPDYLNQISLMMTDQTRKGIRLDGSSIMNLGQKFRDSVSTNNKRLFQGFAGLGTSQGVIGSARGVFGGGTSGIDQSLMLAELQRTNPNADAFELARILETGGEGGEEYEKLFDGVLKRLQSMATTESSRRSLAFSLQQSSTMFGDMGLDQILALLQGGGSKANIDTISEQDAIDRAGSTVGNAQKRLATQGVADVKSAKSGYETRLEIMELEAKVARDMRGLVEDIERKSVKMVKGVMLNYGRFGDVIDLLTSKYQGHVNVFKRFGNAMDAVSDIFDDILAGKKSLTKPEAQVQAKKKAQAKRKRTRKGTP